MNGGQKLKEAREARKLSVLELAEKLDVTQPTIWRIENNGQIPSKETLLKIVEFSDGAITPNDFYGVTTEDAA